jgi:hypothetical protein
MMPSPLSPSIAWLLLLLALGGCALQPTGYVDAASVHHAPYGYRFTALGGDDYSVFVRANVATARDRVAKIALLRAAHLTLEQGGDRFALIHADGMSYRYTTLNSVVVGGALLPVGTAAGENELAALVVHIYRPGDALPGRGVPGGDSSRGDVPSGVVYEARRIVADLDPEFEH